MVLGSCVAINCGVLTVKYNFNVMLRSTNYSDSDSNVLASLACFRKKSVIYHELPYITCSLLRPLWYCNFKIQNSSP